MDFILNSLETIYFYTRGIPLDLLEYRLRPRSIAEKSTLKDSRWRYHSEEGFLGPNESLLDVIVQDYRTVKRLGKTYRELAIACYRILTESHREAYERDVSIGKEEREMIRKLGELQYDKERFELVKFGWGIQPCPWCNNTIRINGGDVFVVDKKNPEDIDKWPKSHSLVVPDLAPHLINFHYFFQGKGSPYRTDPEILVEFLESSKR
ncbi:MAG: hypothetical protein NT129_00730 [Candidatus Aenigmarchaeota archaeon]|nr:hypothetical protein [Candidatus Aenigmarchaeota archaeon]